MIHKKKTSKYEKLVDYYYKI